MNVFIPSLVLVNLFIFLYICVALYPRLLTYLCRRELRSAIQREGYYERFNHFDSLIRRHGVDLDDYVSHCRAPTIKELFALRARVHSLSMAKRMPWRFMFFNPKMEGGFPHTHGPFIMLPDVSNVISETPKSTYLHENIHVWQRYNPILAYREVLDSYPDMKVSGIVYDYSMHRANPDTNRLIYGNKIRAEWTNDAKTLIDIKDKRDHPYEMIAYEKSDQIKSDQNIER